ncbi:sulfatase-like hydrolase/transferase [Negadavirga shengliensis]|uniref:Sulfatase-like hydrolase/transferase n=1 Tax=Negadavirga shengliensis TaxID=1389218 RepID=A0ABV9SWD6_9BACT
MMITQNISSNFCLIIVFLLGSFACSQAVEDDERPNILWIVSEDNSPFLGAYGDEYATTPHLDALAAEGVTYLNAYATAPVCAPARSSLITGMYPNSLGTENMRSTYPIPNWIHFYPQYLKDLGYYTSNNAKKDYNTTDQPEVWDESSNKATYKNRKEGQPFFSIFNLGVSHESSLHEPLAKLHHDPETVPIPPYHPHTPEMKRDWAQYYDKVMHMDDQVGAILQELEDAGLKESTIVFYYGDHGGVLGRSKRFLYESGLRVPLIVYFPEKFRHLAPDEAGGQTDRLVTFTDFAPTLLSLVGAPIPDYMQGKAFLGEQAVEPRDYAFSLRGRMDERFDLSRTAANKQYRYVRHYMPHKIYGQYIEYLWRAPSMRSWEREFLEGGLDEVQSRFWKPKPVEELYDITADPHNVNNLAGDPNYGDVLEELRKATQDWQREIRDVGFVPEPMMIEISKTQTLYDFARSAKYDFDKVLATAELAAAREMDEIGSLMELLDDEDPIVRYWAVTGCVVRGKAANAAKEKLQSKLEDQEISVRLAAAEALYVLGEREKVMPALIGGLESDNLMARVMALNILENMDKDALPAMESARKLVSDDNDYDIRAAIKLVDKLEAY